MKQRVRIGDARALVERYQLSGLLIWAYDGRGHTFQSASYGATKELCVIMADLMDQVREAINRGTIEPRPELMAAMAVQMQQFRSLVAELRRAAEIPVSALPHHQAGDVLISNLLTRAANAVEQLAGLPGEGV